MAGEWKQTSLAGVATDVSYGYTESASPEKVGPHFLRITDIQNGSVDWKTVPYCPISEREQEKYRLLPGDIVIARTGNSTGENYLYHGIEDAVFASYLIRFRIDIAKACPQFIWYNLRTTGWWSFINNSKTGSAQAGANAKLLGQFSFALPPLPEQKRIAEILGSLDDKIELNRKMNETLEAMARAIFKSWFVDFDPVVAKSQGRKPEGMDAETAKLFPSSLIDSEIGQVPKGWKVLTCSEMVSLDRGVSYKGEYLSDAGCPMVNLGCFFGRGEFRREKIKGYAGPYRSNNVIQAGDLLIANTDMTQNRIILGSPILLPKVCGEQTILFSHHVFALRFRDDPTNRLKLYLYYCLLQPSFRERAEGYATGTTVLALPKDSVLSLPILRPPDEVLTRFADLVMPMRDKIAANELSDELLAKTRDCLLPRLLSGEIQTKGWHGDEINA